MSGDLFFMSGDFFFMSGDFFFMSGDFFVVVVVRKVENRTPKSKTTESNTDMENT